MANNTTPHAQLSAFRPSYSFPMMISGQANESDPHRVVSVAGSGGGGSRLASPKSARLMSGCGGGGKADFGRRREVEVGNGVGRGMVRRTSEMTKEGGDQRTAP